MDGFWEYLVNEAQNWEFRIEDILLHSLTGVIIALGIKIKEIFKKIKQLIAVISVVTGVFLVALYFFLRWLELPIEEIRTFMFVALSLDSIFFAFSFKSLHKPIWKIPIFNNRYLFAALGISLALLIGAVALPPLQTLLSLTVLTRLEILLLVGIGLFNLFVIELVKYLIFERRK